MSVVTKHSMQAYRAGCRCAICRDANRLYHAAQRRERKSRAATDAPHGTPGAYMNWSCRCDACKAAYMPFITERRRVRGY